MYMFICLHVFQAFFFKILHESTAVDIFRVDTFHFNIIGFRQFKLALDKIMN